MAATEARLNQLFNRARDVLGPAEAETMMEIMRTSLRGDLATGSDLGVLGAGLRGEMAALSADLRGEMASLSSDLRGDLRSVEQRMDDRFTAMTRTFVTWMLASQAAFTTIVAVFFTVAT